MSKRAEGDNQGRKGQSKGKQAKPKGKAKRKRSSSRGTTKEARKRAAGIIPSPNFAVIAGDPLKAQIVAVALQRLYSPSEYAKEAGLDVNVASYAFKVLKDKGIIELVETIKVRGATIKHMYRATQAALVSDADWGELAEALRPLFTGTIIQDFNTRTTQAIETGHLFSRDDFCLYWAPADLDEIAWKEQAELANWFIEASKQLVVETANRRANGEGEGGSHVTVAIAAFPSPTHAEYMEFEKKHKAKGGKGKRKAPKGKAKAKDAGGGKAKGTAGKGRGRSKATKGKGKGGKA